MHLVLQAGISLVKADIFKPIRTDASQSNPEYKHNQDVTAPPDPVADGSTSDVPIKGEKVRLWQSPDF